ncbi:endo alpha-1,4 polygalactosaminidase [Streptomyces sp. NPDC001315]|uniref:endo alpha-1,4 polygalactosaminidase n=1 Tax=Streptomyces sp. NPDC001315 TaxID=3364562 RepID=UPI0036C8A2D2
MAARFDRCRDKGFDAVEPDSVDGCRDRAGFPLEAADGLRCDRLDRDRLIAQPAHERGMSAGPEERPRPSHRPGRGLRLRGRQPCAESVSLRLSSPLRKYEPGAWRRPC